MSAIKKCRTCLKINTKMQSLNTKPKMLKVNKTYMDLLKDITKMEIDFDDECKLPQRICGPCCKKIRDTHAFIAQVLKCHHSLVTMVVRPSEKLTECCAADNLAHIEQDSCIKQEAEAIEEETTNKTMEEQEVDSDSCSSVSCNIDCLSNDNTVSLNSSKDRPGPGHVKTEPNSKSDQRELYPECVINETEFDEVTANSDNSSSSRQSSHADPLDNQIDEDNTTGACVEDEMLPVRCDECERVFANTLLLNRHKKDTHLPDELKIQCPSCPVKFSRRYNMYAHMRTFHKTETVREHQIQPRKLTKTDICDQCHRSYSDKYKLMAHIKSKHGPGSVPKKPKQPPKQYLCTLCGLTCTNKSNLEIHYRRRHTGEKPFKCDFCDRGFTRSYEVKVHRRTHTGESPYKCTVCEKAFKRSNKLKIHMRIHTNERPYKCTECEKAFRESKDLNIHRRTHTGERPYKCGVCQSTFTQSNSLKLHQKKKKHFAESSALQSTEFNHAINTFL